MALLGKFVIQPFIWRYRTYGEADFHYSGPNSHEMWERRYQSRSVFPPAL
jgi:hypothetical protein